MNKTELRQLYIKKRLALKPSEIVEKSRKIAGQVIEEAQLLQYTNYHIFLPIAHNHEVYTWPIIEKLWELNKIVIAPVSDFKNYEMTNYFLNPDTELIENHLGIPEPFEARMASTDELDVIFLPLLAFDKAGHRVGYGKGFYDRFLHNTNKQVIKVGLSFFPPVDAIDNVNDWDEKLDFCAMPNLMMSF